MRRQKRRKPGIAISSFEGSFVLNSFISWLRKQLGGNCLEAQPGSCLGNGNPASHFGSVLIAESPWPGGSKDSVNLLIWLLELSCFLSFCPTAL